MSVKKKPLVVVTRKLPDSIEIRMRELFDARLNLDDTPMTSEQLAEAARSADVLVPTVTDLINEEMLNHPDCKLRMIANFGNGVDNIDVSAAHARGITVTNTPKVLTDATSPHPASTDTEQKRPNAIHTSPGEIFQPKFFELKPPAYARKPQTPVPALIAPGSSTSEGFLSWPGLLIERTERCEQERPNFPLKIRGKYLGTQGLVLRKQRDTGTVRHPQCRTTGLMRSERRALATHCLMRAVHVG